MKEFGESSNLETPEEKREKKVLVEVGVALHPMTVDGAPETADNTIYIGIDKERWKVINSGPRHNREAVKKFDSSIYMPADGDRMPFRDRSVDEIVSQNIHDTDISTDLTRFIREASRVLKSDGRLVVVECITPPDIEVLKKITEDAGLSMYKIVLHPPKELRSRDKAKYQRQVEIYNRELIRYDRKRWVSKPYEPQYGAYIAYFRLVGEQS